MSKRARSRVGLLSFLAVLVSLPFLWRLSSASAAPPASATADLASTMIRAGLDPAALAAAGVSANQVATVASRFSTAMAAEAGRLAAADASYASARASSDALRRKIESGLSSAEDRSAHATQTAALSAATAERADALADYFAAATATLSAAQVSALTTIKANRHWELPVEFLVVDRTEPEWVAVRNSLANERISAKNGDEMNPACQSSLASWRANAAVSAARVNSDTNLAAVRSAWDSAAH